MKASQAMSEERLIADFKQAIGLLNADLVWSEDMESIRLELAEYLKAKTNLGSTNHPALIGIVRKLIADENDLSI